MDTPPLCTVQAGSPENGSPSVQSESRTGLDERAEHGDRSISLSFLVSYSIGWTSSAQFWSVIRPAASSSVALIQSTWWKRRARGPLTPFFYTQEPSAAQPESESLVSEDEEEEDEEEESEEELLALRRDG